MKFAIKYPRKKFVEANSILELAEELKLLMITKFDIKDSSEKTFVDIKSDIDTYNISENDFNILQKENMVIFPTNIDRCKV